MNRRKFIGGTVATAFAATAIPAVIKPVFAVGGKGGGPTLVCERLGFEKLAWTLPQINCRCALVPVECE